MVFSAKLDGKQIHKFQEDEPVEEEEPGSGATSGRFFHKERQRSIKKTVEKLSAKVSH
jgi:hypothetical protein